MNGLRRRLCAWAVAAMLAPAAVASAQPVAAIIADADDLSKSTLVGPSGQVYAPDGAGGWVRRLPGGIAADVTGAFRVGRDVFAVGRAEPTYQFDGTSWRAAPAGQRGRTVFGAGPFPTVAIGPHVFVRERAGWRRLGQAPAPIVALWAKSATDVVAATATTLVRLRGKALTALAPPVVATGFVGDAAPYAVTPAGLVDPSKPRAPYLAAPGIVAGAGVPGRKGDLWLVTASPGQPPTLVAVIGGKVAASHALPFPADAAVRAISADRKGHVLVVAAEGRLVRWDGTTFSEVTPRDELPAARPGAGPARTR